MPESGARRSGADSEGERARQRDHPQPVALRPADAPSRRRCVCATSWRRSWSCGSASSRSCSIARRRRRAVDAPRDGDLHRAAAGGAELRDQRRAGDRAAREPTDAAHHRSAPAIATAGRGSKWRTPARALPPEHEAKLFQPFYTTKPVGEGTGLGLSVSYGIIRSHDGRIGYRRSASGGAIFFFELPIVPDDRTARQ